MVSEKLGIFKYLFKLHLSILFNQSYVPLFLCGVQYKRHKAKQHTRNFAKSVVNFVDAVSNLFSWLWELIIYLVPLLNSTNIQSSISFFWYMYQGAHQNIQNKAKLWYFTGCWYVCVPWGIFSVQS